MGEAYTKADIFPSDMFDFKRMSELKDAGFGVDEDDDQYVNESMSFEDGFYHGGIRPSTRSTTSSVIRRAARHSRVSVGSSDDESYSL